MRIVGYGDRLSVAPGERIGFCVSCHEADYEAAIVRLIHGDDNPRGPGFKEEEIRQVPARRHPGRVQDIALGSYVSVDHADALAPDDGFVLSCWVFPTTPAGRRQGLLACWSEDAPAGYGLFIDEAGHAELRLEREEATAAVVTSVEPVPADAWTWLEAGYSAAAGEAWLRIVSDRRAVPSLDETAKVAVPGSLARASGPFLMGAHGAAGGVRGHFNGKLDAPQIARPDGTPIARWDGSQHIASRRVAEVIAGLDGTVMNMPTRAVTGHNWTGRHSDWRAAPDEYGAIFFHDDDLEDAGWEEDFAITVPADLRSGIYAVRLRCAGGEDYVPFFVLPPRGSTTADVCLVIPTFSYLAYANEQATKHHTQTDVDHGALQEQDQYGMAAGLKSLYDTHADGAGYCYSTRLRPIVNMRPKYNLALIGGPHQFNADLHLADWLEAEGCAFDVVTDEDLHAEGSVIIDDYRVVLTGTHPEYVSWEILDALESYTAGGGRLIYLGANGFYWVTSVDPERPHVVEVRRGGRGGTWRNAPGEYHHATTGELGGLWRERGRAPQRLVGIGSAGMGFARALPFQRTAGADAPEAAFIFAGIAGDAVIGADGLVLGGAAGHELDRTDGALGTPPHALVVATASGFTDAYQPFTEEVMIIDGKQGAATNPSMRADVVFFDLPGGGAVFSAGSMCWCACLSQNGYDNALARITGNVLRRFRDPAPFERDGRA